MDAILAMFFAGMLGYDDDLSLFALTTHVLKVILQICSHFSKEHSVLLNPAKSTFIIFGANICNDAGLIASADKELHSVSQNIILAIF